MIDRVYDTSSLTSWLPALINDSAVTDLKRALHLRKAIVGNQSKVLHTLANNLRGLLKAKGEHALAQSNMEAAKRSFTEAIECTQAAFGEGLMGTEGGSGTAT